jgi:hypothetical protein
VQWAEWPLGPRILATELRWVRGGRNVRVLNTHLLYVCREGESEEEKGAFREQVNVSRSAACARCVCARVCARALCGCVHLMAGLML